MAKSEWTTKYSSLLLLFIAVLFCHSIITANGVQGDYVEIRNQDKPSLRQRMASLVEELGKSSPSFQKITALIEELSKSSLTPLDRAKSLIHQVQESFFPPNLDFRSENKKEPDVGSKMKNAVKKSLETSEATLEETAESAANVVGEAAHKTKEKVKGNLFEDDAEGKAEL